MNKEISVNEFARLINNMASQYPNAHVVSVGTAYKDGKSYFMIWLDDNGKEVFHKIPMLSES